MGKLESVLLPQTAEETQDRGAPDLSSTCVDTGSLEVGLLLHVLSYQIFCLMSGMFLPPLPVCLLTSYGQGVALLNQNP